MFFVADYDFSKEVAEHGPNNFMKLLFSDGSRQTSLSSRQTSLVDTRLQGA